MSRPGGSRGGPIIAVPRPFGALAAAPSVHGVRLTLAPFSLLGALGAALPLFRGVSLTAGISDVEHKTLTRFHDPVVVQTSALAGLPDYRTATRRLYGARSGVLDAIPYQLDARDAGLFPAG